MLKSVGSSGQLTLGKRFAGQYFEIEELPGGELLLRPVKLVRRSSERSTAQKAPAFEIAEVKQVVMPARAERNARR